MNRICSVCLGGILAALMMANGALAQNQAPLPVEIWACNFVNGSDMEDLATIHEDFNEWADDNGIDDYFLSTMTPIYMSPDDAYDILYLGAWASGAAMGAGYTKLYSESFSNVASALDQTLECQSHAEYVGLQVVPWSEDRDNAPIQFQDCTVRENISNDEAIASIADFVNDGNGPNLGGFAVLLPFVGAARDASYSFKRVAVYNSMQNLGDAFDFLMRQGGMQDAAGTLNRTMTCDQARVYLQSTVRNMVGPE